ncbi:MAG TPA: cobyrinate a,c-diamide synthase [Verrucomicrobia bacterium]|nr:cobyrinate a,c-diamide synthase [Verrucomicrobiota bacterium]
MSCPALLIGAASSGAGKTTLSLALARALTRRGLRVQTFKVGPDFLDPTHLALASGRPCYNLDGWMCGPNYVREVFAKKTVDADFAVIEGVMGLFDGASPDSIEGSSAEVARLLGVPVLLVTHVRGMSRSVAALVKGFSSFEAGVTLGGVIANHCGSAHHAELLRTALQTSGLPPLLGAIPSDAFPSLASRHLGLVGADEALLSPGHLSLFADVLEQHADVEAMMNVGQASLPVHPSIGPLVGRVPLRVPQSIDYVANGSSSAGRAKVPAPFRIGVARDAAFSFYYPDNLEALEAQGACLVPFSPLTDPVLPTGLDAIYLGGGYPENHAEGLSANHAMLDSLRNFAAGGGAVFAECGGMMLLAQSVETMEGVVYPMAGILPVRTRMRQRRQVLGYVEVELADDGHWGRQGDVLRGHEFHYSEIIDPTAAYTEGWQPAYQCRYRRSEAPVAGGMRHGRILAGYPHLHFASRPDQIQAFVKFIKQEGTR